MNEHLVVRRVRALGERLPQYGGLALCGGRQVAERRFERRLRRGSRRVLFIATGALMSQTTFLQKESIPAVAHLVELTAPEKES